MPNEYDIALERIVQAGNSKAKTLNLQGFKLSELPPELFELIHLRELNISRNKLKKIPVEICLLQNLTTLNIDGTEFGTRLQDLTPHSIPSNQLSELPAAIRHLHKLKYLNLRSNQLKALPAEIGELQELTTLDLSGNQIVEIPPEFGQLENLSALNISNNQIKELPSEFSQLKSLSVLNLSGNQILELPPEFDKLSQLSALFLSGNRFNAFPMEITHLESLFELDISNNELNVLPVEIIKLPDTLRLNVDNNPLETPPLEVASQGIGAIREYFRQLDSKGVDYLYEAKLVIVGEPGAGKTSLVRKIFNRNNPLPKEEETTRGIDVQEWHYKASNGKDLRVNIWDFGGQEIYKATHQFFLTKRSLYILLADAREESTDYFNWLHTLEVLSDGSPVMIVHNEKHDRQKKIDMRQYHAKFESIKAGPLACNLATNRGVDHIVENIRFYFQQLPHIGAALPKNLGSSS